MERERVQLKVQDAIAHVILSRPDKLNALDMPMFEALATAASNISTRTDIKAVVLSGDGRAFCAGLDVQQMVSLLSSGSDLLEQRTHGEANIFQYCAVSWRRMPVPVIAALHGPVFGGGLQIASGADIRIAAPDTTLCVREVHWGLVPDMGATLLFDGLVRPDILRDLFYTARIVDGAQAQAIGLVTEIADDPLGMAMAKARAITEKDRAAIVAAKRLLNAMATDAPALRLANESREQVALIRSGVLQADRKT